MRRFSVLLSSHFPLALHGVTLRSIPAYSAVCLCWNSIYASIEFVYDCDCLLLLHVLEMQFVPQCQLRTIIICNMCIDHYLRPRRLSTCACIWIGTNYGSDVIAYPITFHSFLINLYRNTNTMRQQIHLNDANVNVRVICVYECRWHMLNVLHTLSDKQALLPHLALTTIHVCCCCISRCELFT